MRWWRRCGRRILRSRRARRWRCWRLSPGRTASRPAGGGGRPRKVPKARLIRPADPDARPTRKPPEARRDGYRAHLAGDPETGIITDEKLTKAAGQDNSDPAVAEEFLAAEAGDEAGAGAEAVPGAGQGEAGPAGAPQAPAPRA